MKVRSFRSGKRGEEGRGNKNNSGIKYDGWWRRRRRVFPQNEFRPVYFAYSISPTKTRLSVFSRLIGAEEEIFWLLKHIPAGGCLRLSLRPPFRKFASIRRSIRRTRLRMNLSSSVSNVIFCVCMCVSFPLFRRHKDGFIYVALLKYNMLL